jgi:hypothetical protein
LTEFSLRLKSVAERKGIKTLILTSNNIARDVSITFHLSQQSANLRLQYQESIVNTQDIEGVYCGINAFELTQWNRFSLEDAKYAAQETQATWLAILTSLPCRVVNPPALDSLGGTLLSTPEILYLAHRSGFQIPMVIDLESGEKTREVLATGIPACYADLGELLVKEISSNQVNLSDLEQNEDHFRVIEKMPGKPVYVTLLDGQFFACEKDTSGRAKPIPLKQIPRPVRARLRRLHKRLNLSLAEYFLHFVPPDNWVFSGYWRPPVFGVVAYGDTLLNGIVTYAIGKEE